MSLYALVLLSKREHIEGYLDTKLNELVKEELASDGFQNRDNYFMNILYDYWENPHIMFDLSYYNEVKNELEKRVIKTNGFITASNQEELIKIVSDENLPRIIAERDKLKLKTFNFN